jgi:pimeloyl-ACP methyl ester carboxylesterase
LTAFTALTALALVQGGPTMPETMLTGEAQPRFGRVLLETGIQMHFAEAGDAAGEPIVLLHGYSDSWFSFSTVLPLIPETYHVFALDLRGHGLTDKPASGYGMDEMADDVVAFMTHFGIENATVIGHSTGGYVAQHVAAAAAERVARLGLIATTTTPKAIIDIDELDSLVRGLSDPVPADFIRDFQYSTIHRPLTPDFINRVVIESSRLPAHVWRGVMNGMLAMEPLSVLAGNEIPTMVLWGARDTLMPRSEQEALVRMLPNVAFKVYRDTGHALHWERPDEFVRDLVAFVTG